MRVTTGIAGGRELFVPKTELRPTQDKVRQAMFSSLGAAVVGCRFLDLFAGSGSVGIEAWSRGADFVCCVEKDFKAVDAIGRNVAALKIPPLAMQVLKADVEKFIVGYRGEGFDFVFADPPYRRAVIREQRSEVKGQKPERSLSYERPGSEGQWLGKVLSLVGAASILRPDGLLIFEQGSDEAVCDVPGWGVVQSRDYGAARLVFYRKAG